MVKPLDVFLRDHVRPLLKEKGFSKKGRDFRLDVPERRCGDGQFRSRQLGYGEVEFLVDGGVHPLP